jgi:hypothetical protein
MQRPHSERKTATKSSHLRDELLRVEEHRELDSCNQTRDEGIKQHPDEESVKLEHDVGSSKEDSKLAKIKVKEEESEKLEHSIGSSKRFKSDNDKGRVRREQCYGN